MKSEFLITYSKLSRQRISRGRVVMVVRAFITLYMECFGFNNTHIM